MSTLQIIIASTRPGRVGLPVATWFAEHARTHGAFAVEVIDLAEVALPLMDEPHHPRLQQYEHAHTREWSARIDRGDAFVFVTPEYNHSFGAPLKNAIDFLSEEWKYKPVGFVSYGGLAAGTRALQALKPVVTGLRMSAVPEAVTIPFVQKQLDESGQIVPSGSMTRSAEAMLDELQRMESALRPLRVPVGV